MDKQMKAFTGVNRSPIMEVGTGLSGFRLQ